MLFKDLSINLKDIFGANNTAVSLFYVPTYPTGMWSFQWGLKGQIVHPLNILKTEIFKNIEPFMEYTRSTLEKNRKVYDEFLKNKDLNDILKKINNILKEKIKANGNLKITKLVGGISACNSID